MVIDQELTERYAIYNGDCIPLLAKIPDESIHLTLYSPPFRGMYHYSSSERDLSNCADYDDFFKHFEFVVKEISRVTMPGRISAVHCMDTPRNGANICGYEDFPGDIIRLYEKHGFEYTPRISIWKEPLGVRNRTMSKSLAHIQIVEDSTKTCVAASDYLIPFRKKGENPVPVVHPTGLTSYAGERKIPEELYKYRNYEGRQTGNKFSHWIWRHYASSFWDDIRLNNVLPYQKTKDDADEKHVHPLQLDVIERACVLWTNPGETVLTPFMGVGSEVYGAIKLGRKGVGMELKPSYFRQAKKNLAAIDVKKGHDIDMFSMEVI
jgi:DNA modification methylase